MRRQFVFTLALLWASLIVVLEAKDEPGSSISFAKTFYEAEVEEETEEGLKDIIAVRVQVKKKKCSYLNFGENNMLQHQKMRLPLIKC